MKTNIIIVFFALLSFILIGCDGTDDEVTEYTPVLGPSAAGAWDDEDVRDAHVIYDSVNSKYIMYYAGCSSDGIWHIGYAESTDGITWDKTDLGAGDTNRCLSAGFATWNAGGVLAPTVVIDASDNYHMWYTGYNATVTTSQIGYAMSTDGIDWTEDTTAVLEATAVTDDFDEKLILDCHVMYDLGTYHMWYTGIAVDGYYRIGYTSTTTPNTISNAAGPISGLLPNPGTFTHYGMYAPFVLFDSSASKYKMWPTAIAGLSTIAYSESTSVGTNWAIPGSPVLQAGKKGFDELHVGLSSVMEHPTDTGFQMWYTGSSDTGFAIGYADSSDGFSWSKYTTEE